LWVPIFSLCGMRLAPAWARARVLAKRGEGVRSRPAGSKLGDFHMKTVVALLRDKAGASSTKLALMIGLSSSAVLILVRIGVAAAGQ
jgi:hypothetical protein